MSKIINLLPKARQDELHFEAIFKGLSFAIAISIVSFLLVFGTQLFIKFYLNSQQSEIQSNIDIIRGQVSKQENAEVRAKVKTVNDWISDYKSLADGSPKWSKVFDKFAVLPPAQVRITSFNLDLANKRINISGFSPTRELVRELYDNILADKDNFYGIDFPLQHLIQARNVNFQFSFFIKDEVIK